MSIVATGGQEPSDDEIYQAIKTALAQLGFDEMEVFDSFIFGKTAYFEFDATGRTIKICIEEVK